MNDHVAEVTPLEAPAGDEAVPGWLAKHANEARPFLLAHADDGAIWGGWAPDGFRTSHEVLADVSPELLGTTLQQAFVFGESDEVRLFRDELGQWEARRIVDPEPKCILSEDQLLWGDEVVTVLEKAGFTHIRDAAQRGMAQVLPVLVTAEDVRTGKRPRLRVHHFVQYDKKTGEARIGLSRLVRVGVWAEEAK